MIIHPCLNYYVSPDDQGKTVEVAYALDNEGIIDIVVRRVTDRSTGDVEYHIAPMEDVRGAVEPWRGAANLRAADIRWRPA